MSPRVHDGKHALFSTAVRKPGTVVLECGSCRGRSRVSYVHLARAHLPFSVWLPWQRHSRLLTCPACAHRTWVSVYWFR